jgi:hypothetical protein
VNTTLTGKQYAPSISAVGTDYFVTWASIGQDSTGQGVYGQFLNADASPVGTEFRVNTGAIPGRIAPTPVLAADSSGRFLSVWSSFTGLRTDMDLFGRVFLSSGFVAGGPNVYTSPPVETFDDSADPASPPVLDPPPVVSNPGTNSFAYAKASYSGFFYDKTNGLSPSSSGFFTLNASDKGLVSAKFSMGGRSYNLSTRFDATGRALGNINRGGALHALNVKLQADSSGSIQGTISDGRWTADVVGNRLISAATKALAAPFVGNYTVDIPGIPVDGSPGGDGFGTVKVDASGNVRLAASLADGTKISQTAVLSESGIWPLYTSAYQGLGEVMGWMQFGTNGVNGQLVWMKQSGANTKIYPSGFTNQVDSFGSLYRAPAKGQRVLALNNGNGNLALTGGGMSSIFNNAIAVDANNRVTSAANPTLKLTITSSTGLFKGSIRNPDSGLPLTFQGALFPDRNLALGYFLGPGGAGQISVEPAP